MSITYICWNVGNANADKVTADLLRLCESRPVLIGLNEVGDRKRELARVVRQTGYRLVRLDSHPNSAKTAALVRPGVKVDFAYLVPLSKRTRVGKFVAGARKDGHAEDKYVLAIGLTVPPVNVSEGVNDRHSGRNHVSERVVGIVHYVPSAMRRRNWRARLLHARQVRRTARWLSKRKRAALVMGDMNADVNKPRQRRMLKRLDRIAVLHHVASHGRRHIDVVATTIPGDLVALPRGSSDHLAVCFTED